MSYIRQYILTIIGFIFIGALPFLFEGISMNISLYLKELGGLLKAIFNPAQLTYSIGLSERGLFPYLFTPVSYSLIILLGSLVISLIGAVMLVLLVFLLKRDVLHKIRYSISILEGVPDIFLLLLIQVLVVSLYKKTGYLLLNFTTMPGEQIYFLPIFLMSILPTLYLFRMLVIAFDEERFKSYVELARSKGIAWKTIILKHIFPNVLLTLFNNINQIIWIMLSSQLIIEYLLNSNGVFMFIYNYLSPEVLMTSLILLYTPLFVILLLFRVILNKRLPS
ncbi:ABC transporter permease subunit [Guptibacillus algicola]|uniref:ABC transporter permease subunit n=1 Tax=Guptibacillus algicola TaxID=225844 RepID=UPI001CD4640E|nr:ABC transporter permease subunit [Alkalihalobacillus algicola]MCA0986527.1 ABC transporter permease subunit [Alkalihalobacillus algicola]